MSLFLISDPIFWVCAVFAVITTGISKGGLGGLGIFAVPVMALAISPVQAAAIMLPVLIVMDWTSVAAYRKHWDKRVLVLTLPGAIIGIAIGGFLARYVNEDFVRIAVAVIALGFVTYALTKEFLLKSEKLSRIKDNRPLYAMLGQFDKTNLSTSLMLMPLAPIGVLIGVWLIKRIDETVFFRVLYALLVMVGVKLLWDGLS